MVVTADTRFRCRQDGERVSDKLPRTAPEYTSTIQRDIVMDTTQAITNSSVVDPPGALSTWDMAGESVNGFDHFLDSMLPSLGEEVREPGSQASGEDSTGGVDGKGKGDRKRARNNLAQKKHRERKKVIGQPALLCFIPPP